MSLNLGVRSFLRHPFWEHPILSAFERAVLRSQN